MNFMNLLRSTFREICCRKRLFCGITIILIISFLVIDYSLIVFGSVFAREKVVRKIVKNDTETIYFLNLEKYKLLLGDTSDKLVALLNRIGEVPDVDCYGTYWDGETFIIEGKEYAAVVVSEGLADLCNVEGLTENMLKHQEGTDYTGVVLGYEIGKQYPEGAVIQDSDNGKSYIVTKVLPRGSRWLDTDIRNGIYIDLDSQVLIGADNYFADNTIFVGNGLNNFCYRISRQADADKVKGQVMKCADESGIEIYSIHNLNEKIRWGWKELGEGREELYLSVFLLFSATLAMLVASLITIFVRKKDIGVLYVNGYSKKDIMLMYIMENIIKVMVAFCVAGAYWSRQQYTIFGWSVSIMGILLPWSLLVAVLLILLGSVIPLFQIRKLQPVDLIGKNSI